MASTCIADLSRAGCALQHLAYSSWVLSSLLICSSARSTQRLRLAASAAGLGTLKYLVQVRPSSDRFRVQALRHER